MVKMEKMETKHLVGSKNYRIPVGITITQLLEQQEISPLGLAVAINNQVISKTQWNNTLIENKQEITIIRATQGG